MINKIFKEKQGQLRKILITLLLISLIPLGIVIAQNITNGHEHETSEFLNETIEPLPPNETTLTIPEENITIPINETNQTTLEPESTPEPEPIPEPESNPELNIQLFHPNKITRGKLTEIKALITNSGTKARNVRATWELPHDFEIIKGSQIENCGDLDSEDSCIATINIQTSYSTSLGENQIKMRISYENET